MPANNHEKEWRNTMFPLRGEKICSVLLLSIFSVSKNMGETSNISKMVITNVSDHSNISKMVITNVSEQTTNDGTQFDFSSTIVLIVSILGVIGNTVTLCAFRYAKVKKKYLLHRSWKNITVFIWNLAIVDLLSSLNMTILFSQLVFYPNSLNNWTLCVTEITLRDIFVLVNAVSIACIAVVTMVGVLKNNLWENFCDQTFKVNVLITLLWISGFAVYIPKLINISDILHNTDIEKTFDCGIFFYDENLSNATLYSEFLLHGVVIVIIIFSYGIISVYATNINSNVDARREGVHLRDTNTSKLVFIICTVYIFQCTPYMVCRMFFSESLRAGFFIQFPLLQKISYTIYYTQFLPNIIIYVTRNENYRNAYVLWIRAFLFCDSKKESVTNSRENTLKNLHRHERKGFPIGTDSPTQNGSFGNK